jgi:hypothetical protein
MAAFAGLKAFANRREQRNSQMRHPVHFEVSTLIGNPFLRVIKILLSEVRLFSFFSSPVPVWLAQP